MSLNAQTNDFKSPSGPPAHEPAPIDAAPVYSPNPDSTGVPPGGMPPVRFGLAAAGMNTGPTAQPPNEMIANHAQPGVPGFQFSPEKDATGSPYPADTGYTQANPPRDPSSYSTPPLNPQQQQSPHQQQSSTTQYFTTAVQPPQAPLDGQMSQQQQPQFTGGFAAQPGQQMPYMQTPPPGAQYQQQPGASPYSQPGASPYPSPGQQPQVTTPYAQPVAQGGTPVVMAINPICAQQGHRPYQPTPVCGILWAVLCFPFGLICLFQELGKPPVCANCGVEVVGPQMRAAPMMMAPSQQYQQQQFAQQQYMQQQQQYTPQQQYQQPQMYQTPPQPSPASPPPAPPGK